jgi:adenine/guanine phosphoribosyltransferase-like PRPP-binding protein
MRYALSMNYWQQFEPNDPLNGATVYRDWYPVAMPDGSFLRLPLRDLGDRAVAGLIANQAAFAVVDQLAQWMAARVRPLRPEVVVGLPTLGHVFGALVARCLGHANWVAPGTSRKLWYEDALSVPLSSITAPTTDRRMWLDPRLVDRLRGRRVLLVDDVISTGASARSGLALLRLIGVEPVALAVAMTQTDRWRDALPTEPPVVGVFHTPQFRGVVGGWQAESSQVQYSGE